MQQFFSCEKKFHCKIECVKPVCYTLLQQNVTDNSFSYFWGLISLSVPEKTIVSVFFLFL